MYMKESISMKRGNEIKPSIYDFLHINQFNHPQALAYKFPVSPTTLVSPHFE